MDNFGRKARGASVGALASDEHAKRREKCALRQARIAPMTAPLPLREGGCVLPYVFEAVTPLSADAKRQSRPKKSASPTRAKVQ